MYYKALQECQSSATKLAGRAQGSCLLLYGFFTLNHFPVDFRIFQQVEDCNNVDKFTPSSKAENDYELHRGWPLMYIEFNPF